MSSLGMVLTAAKAPLDAIGGADGPTAVFVTAGSVGIGSWLLWLSLAALMAYLLGSLNFGILVSRYFYRDDVRKHGSGNAGSTNILRTYGKKAAILTLLGDMGKGVLAVVLGRILTRYGLGGAEFGIYGGYVAAVFAVLGHLWPVWFGFKGGKGVATAAGAILASNPVVFLGLAVVFWALALTTRIVSLSSIAAAVCYPIFTGLYAWFKHQNIWLTLICSIIMAGLVIWMHRENIKRLMNGTEYKFGEKKK